MSVYRLYFLVGLGFLIVLLIACGNEKSNSQVIDPMKSEKLTKEALGLSWDLLEKGQALADSGKSISEILKILPDSTLYQTNAGAILFFLEGSVPMLIALPRDPNAPMTKGVRRTMTSALGNKATTSFAASLLVEGDEEVNVVAHEKGEEEREEKKALIISPYITDFGNYDDGLVAYDYLSKNKNYKDRVAHLKSNVTLDSYTSFGEYDVVHLSTHGERFCEAITSGDGAAVEITYGGDSNFCRTIIDTGVKHNLQNRNDRVEFFLDPDNFAFAGNVICQEDYFYLKSSFFDEVYGSGLSDKIWIFSACEMGQRSDLTASMENIHQDGHILYWTNVVSPVNAYAAFEQFYKYLSKEGLDANQSFEEIPISLREGLPSLLTDPYDEQQHDTIWTTTSLHHLQTGDPRHGIEIIEMYHLEEEDQRVESGDFYPLIGDFGDGEDEALTLKVELKGYTRAKFQEKQMTLSLKVEGETILDQRPFLPDVDNDEIEVEDLEDQEYGVEVTIADIPIPDVGEKRFIKLDARLHFDDGRFSIHSERVSIRPTGILTTIVGDGQHLILTYNEETEAMKIQSANTSKTNYMDRDGWLYTKDNQSGWMKMNLSGMMGMSMGGIVGSNVDMSGFQELVENDLISQETSDEASSATTFGEMYQTGGNANFFLPMIEWGMRFKGSDFERNSSFRSQLVDCGKPQPCRKFTGYQGQAIGVEATFSPGGQIIRIKYQGKTITYDYGNYFVTLPEAREFKLPFFNN